MSEQAMRQHIIRALRPLDAVSVENPAYPGTPDVNFIEGWIELKWERNWPVRADSIVRIDHFTQQQRVWLKRRWRYGGNVWLLFCCAGEWLLFSGETAAEYVGRVTREHLYLHSHKALAFRAEGWRRSPLDEVLLREILTCGRKAN